MDASANTDLSANPVFSQKHEAIIALVMRQTDYTREVSIQKLQLFKGDYIKVIREYINPAASPQGDEKKTVNQTIMSEIRYFMDDVNKGYEQRKKKAAFKQRIIQYRMLKQQQKQLQQKQLQQKQLQQKQDQQSDQQSDQNQIIRQND